MCDPVEDDITIFNREYRAPIPLTQAERSGRTGERTHVWVPTLGSFGNFFESLQQSLRVCARQSIQLSQNLRRNDQRHSVRSLTASSLSRYRRDL
jgi:hypothetical protein